jgi:signal peptidase I
MADGKSIFREYAEALLIAAIFLRFANTFVVQTFYIPSGSMEDTLLIGDHLFVNRFIYGPAATPLEEKLLPLRPVHRGDIVVFRSPENPTMDLVKRCIGVGGDSIEVIDKQLYIGGKAVDDASYALHKDPRFTGEPRDRFGPRSVPADNYFCMGDNRDNSNDSRFWGEVPQSHVKGRAFMVYWSFAGEDEASEVEGTPWERLRQIGRVALTFFNRTRWSRTFRIVR